MDSPAIAPDEHRRALQGLVKVNRASRTAQTFWPKIRDAARRLGRDRLTLLDVACGGGDVPLTLYAIAARNGLQLDITLADRSEVALTHARESAGTIPLNTIQCSATDDALPHADIVTNSLFLHHLDEPDVVRALAQFSARAKHLLLVSDLVRSSVGLAIAWTACRVFSSSQIMHHDGPASVRAAWRISEMRNMCQAAGLQDVSIRRTWPWRMLVRWGREG